MANTVRASDPDLSAQNESTTGL